MSVGRMPEASARRPTHRPQEGYGHPSATRSLARLSRITVK